MKFGIHHASWLDSPGPAEIFETTKAKAQWAEGHGFDWFSDPRPALAAWPRRDRAGDQARRLVPRGSSPGFVGTVSEAVDLIGQYGDAGIDLLITVTG